MIYLLYSTSFFVRNEGLLFNFFVYSFIDKAMAGDDHNWA